MQWRQHRVREMLVSTPTASTSPMHPPPPPSAWVAGSANASTAPSAPYHPSAGPLRIDQNTSTFIPYPVPRDRSHELTVRRT